MTFPTWVEDRRFVVYLGSKPVAALYIEERATAYCEKYNKTRPGSLVETGRHYWVLDRGA